MKNLKHFLAILLISLLSISWVKADNGDTLTYQLPHSHQFLCVDVENLPTFVFHKPNGFGSTLWYINSVYYDNSDAIVFEPTDIGYYNIRANSSGNIISMGITLYNTLPGPADFEVTNGIAHFNENKDTLWLCGASASVKHGIPGSTFTYSEWNGPNGYNNQTSGSITVTESGWYSFTATNPCGSVTDSFYVAPRPSTLPVFEDLLFCNEDPIHTFDAGEGFSYLWKKDGEIVGEEQTLEISEGGSYSVDLNNACISGTIEISVEHQTFPLPNLAEYSTNIGEITMCHDEEAFLSPNDNYPYDSYYWTHGDEFISNNPTYTATYPNWGEYRVKVTKGSCQASDYVFVNYADIQQPPNLCVATFDIATGQNKIVIAYDAEDFIEEFVLYYKQIIPGYGIYWEDIARVPRQEGVFVYELLDTINDPNEQSRTYTVLSKHVCGHYSDMDHELADEHSTIMVQKTNTTDGLAIQVVVPYQTKSGWTPLSYDIWIDEHADGNLTQIGVLVVPPLGTPTFNVANPIPNASYYASVSLPWSCGHEKNNSNTVVYSNRLVLNPTDIQQYKRNSTVKIYPNPSNGIFNIEGNDIVLIEVFDNLGRLIHSEKQTQTLDLSSFGQSVYFAKIYTQNGVQVKKLIVE